MSGKPFQVGGVRNLANGEETKDIQLPKIAMDRLFVVEFVGVNGFVQQNQTLFVSLEVYTNSVPGIYPIVTNGTSTISDPAFPARRFGGQRVLLYADPDSQIIVTAARHNGHAAARIFVDISGGSSNLNCHTEVAKLVRRVSTSSRIFGSSPDVYVRV